MIFRNVSCDLFNEIYRKIELKIYSKKIFNKSKHNKVVSILINKD